MPRIAARLGAPDSGAKNPLDALSPREIEILRMLGDGLGMAEIADAMRLSYKTIANSSALMKRKLRARTSLELVRIAMEQR